MILRTIYATTEMKCCRDGDEIYHPLPRQILASQSKEYFEISLTIWRDKAEVSIYNKYLEIAKKECDGMGTTPKLCFFEIRVDDVEETQLSK